ncbi:conserved hypothetical protein [Vibrio chagasii]|nr:conserved hypothetical protein [Vibrio chagasii]
MNKEIVVNTSTPKGSALIDRFKESFEKVSLDSEIIDHLWYLPFSSIYGLNGCPYLAKSIGDQIIKIESDNKRVLEAGGYDGVSKINNSTPEGLAAADNLLFIMLGRGVNKSLPMPTIVVKNDKLWVSRGAITTAHPTVYVHNDDDCVKLSPKNLIKHYKYPEVDAKALFKNIKSNPISSEHDDIYIVKPKAEAYFRNIYALNVPDVKLCCWSATQDPKEQQIANQMSGKSEDVLELLRITDRPIPSFKLDTWKQIAEKRFTRLNPNGDWNALSVSDQKRRVTNLIRHSSVSYVQSWASAPKSLQEHVHDVTFDRVMRQIINIYPWLADECRRQLDQRKVPPKHELN